MPVAGMLVSTRDGSDCGTEFCEERRVHVLVVDDARAERELIAEDIATWGYRVSRAENGEEAVRLYRERRPDIVIMDIMMPGMGGVEAARQISEIAGDDFLAMIFLTALDDPEKVGYAIEATAIDVIRKPYDSVALQAKLGAYTRMQVLYSETRLQRVHIDNLLEYSQNEQEIARRIISQVQEQGAEDLSGFRHLVRSADVLCGDVLLARRRPSGGLNVMLGDLTGHGLAAAVGALPVAQIFNAMTSKGFSAEHIVREINARLGEVLAPGMFCAAILVSFSDDASHAEIWNGGMPELIVFDRNTGKIRDSLMSGHLPLGILSPDDFDPHMDILSLTGEETVYLYTDGLTEAVGHAGGYYGEERLVSVLEGGEPDGAFERVSSDLEEFCGDVPIRDDISLIELPCTPEVLIHQADGNRPGVIPAGRPWSWEIKLAADSLAHLDPVPVILQQIVALQGLEPYRDTLFSVLSELYNNALDHGVLRMDSTIKSEPDGFERYFAERERRLNNLDADSILVKVANEPMDSGGRLVITVRDSGDGFDYQRIIAGWKHHEDVPSGRGLALLREFCDSVRFHGNGNCVQVMLDWFSDPYERALRESGSASESGA